MLDRRPRIAVNGELETRSERVKGPTVTLLNRYADAVWRAGGLPLVIPPLEDPELVDEVLDACDGLLLTGGDDFDTERLGLGPLHPTAKPVPTAKQDFDFRLIERALERDLPTLGICYGMQLMGLTGGARLIQDLADERPEARDHRGGVRHRVLAEPGTKLAEGLGIEPIGVISRHHQALATPGSGWVVAARDDQGLLEGIEHPAHAFDVGVQWHPELSFGTEDEPPQLALFRAFMEAAAQRARNLEFTT